ncbi:MAG: SMP-30/gluconolactonase/LRE family protein, partial [Phycisphaerae bacterium]
LGGPCVLLGIVVVGAGAAGCAGPPAIVATDVVALQLVAADNVALRNVDMLTFDAFGNLFANREARGAAGGVSYVDVEAGTATVLVTGINRADGITLHPSGALYITSETSGASTTDRIYRVDVTYDAANVPISATATSITTSLAIDKPEGIVALDRDSAFGSTGDLYVSEDRFAGRILHLVLTGADTADASVFVDPVAILRRPEGVTFGDFGGRLPAPTLLVAETNGDNVLRIDATGTIGVLGNPTVVGLTEPDNIKFGHDGELYVSEDAGFGTGRIIRISEDGTHEVVLSGFSFPQGMAFDVDRRDLYIAEQGNNRIWRARFRTATGDADGDGDIDPSDADAFERCFGSTPLTLECLVFDFNRDDVIDAQDRQAFVALMPGP